MVMEILHSSLRTSSELELGGSSGASAHFNLRSVANNRWTYVVDNRTDIKSSTKMRSADLGGKAVLKAPIICVHASSASMTDINIAVIRPRRERYSPCCEKLPVRSRSANCGANVLNVFSNMKGGTAAVVCPMPEKRFRIETVSCAAGVIPGPENLNHISLDSHDEEIRVAREIALA